MIKKIIYLFIFTCLFITNTPSITEVNSQNDNQEKHQNEIKKQELKCVRCGKVFYEMIGVDPTFFGHP